MNILVTGSRGFVGNNLVERLSKRYTIFRVVSSNHKILNDGDSTFPVDLSVNSEVIRLGKNLRSKNIECIIHLASKLSSPKESKDIEILETNNSITKNMVQLALDINPKAFINASTIAVYPNSDGIYTENSAVDMSSNSDCLYGLSKFNAEIIFNFFLAFKINVTNLRISHVYGKGMRDDRVIPMLIKDIRENNRATIYGNGERVSNFIHINDVIQAISKIVEKPITGTFNLCNDNNLSYSQLTDHLIKHYGTEETEIMKVMRGLKVKPVIKADKIKKNHISCNSLDFSGIG